MLTCHFNTFNKNVYNWFLLKICVMLLDISYPSFPLELFFRYSLCIRGHCRKFHLCSWGSIVQHTQYQKYQGDRDCNFYQSIHLYTLEWQNISNSLCLTTTRHEYKDISSTVFAKFLLSCDLDWHKWQSIYIKYSFSIILEILTQ